MNVGGGNSVNHEKKEFTFMLLCFAEAGNNYHFTVTIIRKLGYNILTLVLCHINTVSQSFNNIPIIYLRVCPKTLKSLMYTDRGFVKMNSNIHNLNQEIVGPFNTVNRYLNHWFRSHFLLKYNYLDKSFCFKIKTYHKLAKDSHRELLSKIKE